MPRWARFAHRGESRFGTLDRDRIAIHRGNMFVSSEATGETVALGDVELLTPTEPTKMLALWNNFRALGEKLKLETPPEPLYFVKTSNSFLPSGGVIRRPSSYAGKIIYEGELGIVIGKTCKGVSEHDADAFIFGYTCVNDVTAVDILNKDPSFAQWVRAKSFDSFGAFGPVIATGLDPSRLTVRTILNGQERQNYPVSDMIFSPRQLVSRISRDMTLSPGDVICCGTSLGAGTMKEAQNLVEIVIEGIGTLSNRFDQ